MTTGPVDPKIVADRLTLVQQCLEALSAALRAAATRLAGPRQD